jgi:hypothetical protein
MLLNNAVPLGNTFGWKNPVGKQTARRISEEMDQKTRKSLTDILGRCRDAYYEIQFVMDNFHLPSQSENEN